jgi:hypothetical protein
MKQLEWEPVVIKRAETEDDGREDDGTEDDVKEKRIKKALKSFYRFTDARSREEIPHAALTYALLPESVHAPDAVLVGTEEALARVRVNPERSDYTVQIGFVNEDRRIEARILPFGQISGFLIEIDGGIEMLGKVKEEYGYRGTTMALIFIDMYGNTTSGHPIWGMNAPIVDVPTNGIIPR